MQVARDRQRLAELEAQVVAAEAGLREVDEAMREMQSQAEQLGTEVCVGGEGEGEQRGDR